MIVICPHCHNDVVVVLTKQNCLSTAQQIDLDDKQNESVSKQNELKTRQICLVREGGGGVGSGSQGPEIRSGSHTSKIAYSLEFLQFWGCYPRRKNKGDAWKAWRAEKPDLAILLDALAWQSNSAEWRKDGGRFIPYPASYIRARGWEDDRPESAGVARPKTGADAEFARKVAEKPMIFWDEAK